VLDPEVTHEPIVARPGLLGTCATGDDLLVPSTDPAPAADLRALGERAAAVTARVATAERRALLGVAGPPGVGKSTVSAAVVDAVRARGVRAELVPMDGFHLAHAELQRLDRAHVKGAPDTFDAAGFVALLRRLRHRERVTTYAPRFDRAIEEPVAGAIAVAPDVDLVVTEGNYLLLDDGPWADVASLLDETWYLSLDDAVRRDRLRARHERYGRTREQALERTLGSDEANAALVGRTRARADLEVRLHVAAAPTS
jgi:pantothenate kinase